MPDDIETNSRRNEMADFLRSRRSRLDPSLCGLPVGRRRRTPGLRREEVAELADTSITWYTWLEQARPIKVSAGTLEKIGRALLLDENELAYLFDLAQLPLPMSDRAEPRNVADRLTRIASNMMDSPCYTIGARWDLLSWNDLAEHIFSFSSLDDPHPNLIKAVFLSPYFRQLWVNWELDAQELIALVRVDYNQNVHNKNAYQSLISELNAKSPEFKEWWLRHDVVQRIGWIKELNHPTAGRLKLESTFLETPGHPYPRLVIYSGFSEDDVIKLQKMRP